MEGGNVSAGCNPGSSLVHFYDFYTTKGVAYLDVIKFVVRVVVIYTEFILRKETTQEGLDSEKGYAKKIYPRAQERATDWDNTAHSSHLIAYKGATYAERTLLTRFFAIRAVWILDRVLPVAKVPVGHEQREYYRHDSDSGSCDRHITHRSVVC